MTTPYWLQDAIFYQIFPDRFRMGTAHDRVQEGEYTYPRLPANLHLTELCDQLADAMTEDGMIVHDDEA